LPRVLLNCLLTRVPGRSSGISFVDSAEGRIVTIDDWPGSQGLLSPKAPTAIVFGQNAGADRWGYSVSPNDDDAHRLVKLALLHPDQRPAGIYSSSHFNAELSLIEKQGQTAFDVAAALLRTLFTHGLSAMAKESRMTVEEVALHVVVGVPANWRPDARLRLLEAVHAAGIPGRRQTSTVDFFTEPQASAVALATAGIVPANLAVCPRPH